MNSNESSIEKIKILDFVDLTFLQNMQDFFSNTIGIASLLADDDGAVTAPSNFTGFCSNLARNCKKGQCLCQECDLKWGKIAAKEGRPIIYTCHAGLKDFVAPIFLEGRHIASIYGGQVITSENEREGLVEFVKGIGRKESDYIEEIDKIKVITKEKLEAACDLLYHVANAISGILYAYFKLSKMGIDYKLYKPFMMENLFFTDGVKELKPLTHREFEVLKQIVMGRNNNEIAKDLFISVHTVKAHVSTILEKMGGEDRVQVAVKAIREGFVS